MMYMYIIACRSIPANHIKVKDKAAQDLDYKHDSTLFKERYLSQRQHRSQYTGHGNLIIPESLTCCRNGLQLEQLRKIKEKAPSQRRTTFSFSSLPKQSRVDNICKYQWGERCERNEALGRKKNHLIERTKYQSAIRNARKLEIRKRSLPSKVVRS